MVLPVRHRPAPGPRAGSDAPEGGYSLVEILVAIIIMGLVFVAVLAGIFAVLAASNINTANAQADFIARDYAEDLKSDRLPYRECATVGGPRPYANYVVPPKFAGWEVRVSKIEYGNGGTPATWSSTCSTDRGVQRITVTATSPDSRDRTSIQEVVVVKRDTRRDGR